MVSEVIFPSLPLPPPLPSSLSPSPPSLSFFLSLSLLTHCLHYTFTHVQCTQLSFFTEPFHDERKRLGFKVHHTGMYYTHQIHLPPSHSCLPPLSSSSLSCFSPLPPSSSSLSPSVSHSALGSSHGCVILEEEGVERSQVPQDRVLQQRDQGMIGDTCRPLGIIAGHV